MASYSVGNLHILVQMNDRQFQTAAKRVQTTNRVTERSFSRMSSGGMAVANRGLLELSRGVEDFAVVVGTGGLAGGIRAASNNLSQMAFIMGGPLAGAVAGLTVAGVSLWQAYQNGADKAKGSLQDYRQELQRVVQETDRFVKLRQQQQEEALALGTTNDKVVLRQTVEESRTRLEELLRKSRANTKGQQAALRGRDIHSPRSFLGLPALGSGNDAIVAQYERELMVLKNQGKTLDSLIEKEEERLRQAEHRLKLFENQRDFERRQKNASDRLAAAEQSIAARRQGAIDEAAGISEGKREALANREKRRLAVRARRFERAKEIERERNKISRSIDRLTERRDELQERIRNGRRLTELPGGQDIFTVSAQERLSRHAAGRTQVDETQARQLKELEKLNKEIRDLKDKLKKTQPINL